MLISAYYNQIYEEEIWLNIDEYWSVLLNTDDNLISVYEKLKSIIRN